MVMPDPLSEMLALVNARCLISGELRAGGEWAYRFRPDAPVKLDAVVRGSCWLIVDDGPPSRLVAGDAVVLNGVGTTVLCSDPRLRPAEATEIRASENDHRRLGSGDDVVIIGGHVDFDPAAASLFTSALPGVTHASAASTEAAEMRRLLEQIMAETASDHPGARFAIDQHAQLLLLQVLRIGLRGEAVSHPGWLRLLADPRLRPAVSLMHADPGRAWGLADLATAAGMSRSHFAHRFREVSGQPPLTYLSHWRVRLAERALRETDTTVAALAERLGYASESSFSHAFTRIAGVSPSRYRRRGRPSGPEAAISSRYHA
ncbi:AraC family transcriptional regulator [Actinoallomurus iriomotensis]|uniref:AraC family transcriptional regulator n=2 Tax=Actinoallomurus iriomotensis TaxID=478107 RepID=A0A9W6SGD6_9ACTN|nr:AraC family transcriptional regulator [Actinoallomurus iriomotensis]